ncbi:MAG: hypothetical protein H6658_11475 [Ardenticatenaceae bacterium]|nr:hypothetical protein [Ardenticatenaceae bacterium]
MNRSEDELIQLLAVSLADIQTMAETSLGRCLSQVEVETLLRRVQEIVKIRTGWPVLLRHCIEEMSLNAKFEQWLKEVGEEIWAMAACGVEDLPDFDYYSLFVVGSTPGQAAGAVLLSNGFSRFE